MEELNWINAREMNNPGPRLEPPIDKLISGIVGGKVYTTEPWILEIVIKYKRKRKDDGNGDIPDNFLGNPQFIKDIKEAYLKSRNK